MKNLPFPILFLLGSLACNKEPSKLDVPFISYTVNGEEVYEENSFYGELSNDYLTCSQGYGTVKFIIYQPAEGVFPTNNLTYNNLQIYYNDEVYTSRFDATNASSVTITEFDMVNRKASGSFYFEGRSQEDSTKTLLITDGVFNDIYFPEETLYPSDQYGHMNFLLDGDANYYYQVYNFGDNESIEIFANDLDEYISIAYIPLELGVFAIDSATGTHASYYTSTGPTYFNALAGSQAQVITINTTEKSAELNFTLNLADPDGNTVHITEGYVKVYY